MNLAHSLLSLTLDSLTCLALALVTLACFALAGIKTRRVGGLTHFRIGRFGGSFYIARRQIEPIRRERRSDVTDSATNSRLSDYEAAMLAGLCIAVPCMMLFAVMAAELLGFTG